MEKYNSLSGWSGQKNIPGQVNAPRNSNGIPAEYDVSFKNMMTEVFGWSGSVMNVGEAGSPEVDDSNWQNNEDPEAAENSKESVGTGTTPGDTSTDNDLATDEKIGGNAAAGAGAVGGTGAGTGEIGGTTTSSGTGVSGVPAGTGTATSESTE